MKGQATKDKRNQGLVARMCSVSVVCANPQDYKRIKEVVRSFQKVISQLAAENFILQLASSTMRKKQSKDKKREWVNLTPDRNTKKELCASLYGGNPGHQNYYELRPRFFALWDEARKVNAVLPELGSWIWDATLPKFTSAADNEKMKKLNELRVPKFRNFGLSILHCTSRKYASCFFANDDDISFSFRVNNDPTDNISLIASGPFIINNEQSFKHINHGHASLLKRVSEGRLEWLNPTIRIDQDGKKIWVDFSYKIEPRKMEKTGKTLVVLLRPFYQDNENKDTHGEYYLCQLRYLEDGKIPKDCGRFWCKGLRCEHIMQELRGFAEQRVRLDVVNEAAYSMWDKPAQRSIRDRQNNLTGGRIRFVKDQNHKFSREIVIKALQFGCDKIQVISQKTEKTENEEGEENLEVEQSLHGFDWRFFELKQFIKYKAIEKGMEFAEEKCPKEFMDLMQFV